jgi:hypothetical protein
VHKSHITRGKIGCKSTINLWPIYKLHRDCSTYTNTRVRDSAKRNSSNRHALDTVNSTVTPIPVVARMDSANTVNTAAIKRSLVPGPMILIFSSAGRPPRLAHLSLVLWLMKSDGWTVNGKCYTLVYERTIAEIVLMNMSRSLRYTKQVVSVYGSILASECNWWQVGGSWVISEKRRGSKERDKRGRGG